MLRFLGAVLLTGGAGMLGLGAATRLSRRVRTLYLLTEALERMERELSFRLTSVPELFALLADYIAPPVGTFFACCRITCPVWERNGWKICGEMRWQHPIWS